MEVISRLDRFLEVRVPDERANRERGGQRSRAKIERR